MTALEYRITALNAGFHGMQGNREDQIDALIDCARDLAVKVAAVEELAEDWEKLMREHNYRLGPRNLSISYVLDCIYDALSESKCK